MFEVRTSVPELAVLDCRAVGEVEIDAAAAALGRRKLDQVPSFGLVPGAEIGPRGRRGQPAQLGKATRQQRAADDHCKGQDKGRDTERHQMPERAGGSVRRPQLAECCDRVRVPGRLVQKMHR